MRRWVGTAACVWLLFATVGAVAQTPADTTKRLVEIPREKLKLSGFIQTEAGLFRSSRDPGRMPGERVRLIAQPRIRYGNWDIPMTLQVGNFEDRLLQPFNKFGMSPRYKWITAHLGHRQLSFSPFTYHYHLLFGAGLELNPGKFRFAVLHGELNRPGVGGFVALNNVSVPPVFQRTGTMGRIGFGRPENFVDLIFLHGRDQTNGPNFLADSLRVYPEENVVIGIHTEQRIAKYFFLKASGAASAYTLDSRSAETETEDFFMRETLFRLFQPRISSQYMGAYMGQLEYRRGDWQAEASYTHIQPEFQSMGMYFIQSDLQRIAGGVRGRLFDRRLSVQAGYRHERNNLMNQRSSQNLRNFVNTRFTWMQQTAWMASLGITLFSIEQRPVNPEQMGQAAAFDQLTTQVDGNFTRRRADGSPWWSVNAVFINRNDRLMGTSAYVHYSGRGSYFIPIGQVQRWSLQPELGLTTFTVMQSFSSTRIAPGVRLGYRHRQKGVDAFLLTVPTTEINSLTDDAFVWRNGFSSGYRFKRKHRIGLRMDHSYRTGNFAYQEFRGTVTYQYNFL